MKPFTFLPKFVKNFYFLFGVFFLFWMFFIDSNDVVSQVSLVNKLNDLKAQKEFYKEKKIEVLQNREELNSNKELLEKFAREKYMMKKQSEDLYVIVKEE